MATTSPLLASGTQVKIHGLQRSPDLNDRIGTILRSATSRNDRTTVYLPNPTKIIRILPKNLKPIPYTPQTASKKSPTRHNLKLDSLLLASLPDVGFHHLFYPFGNTAPVYVFPSIPRDAPSARVLLLACGDLRSPFYSLARDTPARLGCSRKVNFFVNDFTPEIIARNVVILWLIYRGQASVKTVFAIWFSLRLPTTAYCALVDAVLALTGDEADRELRESHIDFHEDYDWQTVKGVLRSWITWQDALSWEVVTRMRDATLPQFASMSKSELAESSSNVVMFLYSCVGGDSQFPVAAAQTEVREYVRTGVVRTTETAEYTNPTLFQRPDRYSLHYGSDPFSAFPRFAESYDPLMPCLSKALQQMSSWIRRLREHGDNVSWTFSTANCMDLCTQLSGPFDVISTSNVSDHVGLMPLLQVLRGITTPSGTLLTQTLRFSSYCSSIEEYLQKHLIVGPEFYESMLGWRCIGYEGNMAPPDGNVLFSVPSLAEVVLSSTSKKEDGRGTRCELSLIWKPARASNVPLCLTGNENAQNLVEHFLSEVITFPFSEKEGCKVTPGWSHNTCLTILPVVLSCEVTDELLSSEDANVAELRDLVLCIKENRLSEMSVATIQVSQDVLQEFFKTWKTFAGQLELNLIVSRGKRSLPYCGLKGEFDAANGTWSLSWLIHRHRLRPRDRIYLNCFCRRLQSYRFSDVDVKDVNPEDYSVWLRRISCNRDTNFPRGRTEDANTWTVSVKISDNWMEALNQKKTLHASVTKQMGNMIVGVGEKLAHPVVIDLPGPIDTSGTKLKVSRKAREVKCLVKRGKYKISSLLPADSWIDDKDAWIPMKEDPNYMLTVSGFQMSDEEKYIARTRNIAPPLIAAKDTFMFFFQCPEDNYIGLSLPFGDPDRPDVRAIVVHHGLRREHRTGMPAADLSVCFLKHSFLHEMIPWVQKLQWSRHVYCAQEELDLLKQYFDLFYSRCKDNSSWEGVPSKVAIHDKAIRRRFKRMLVQPLLHPSLTSSFFTMVDGVNADKNSAQATKNRGTQLCKDGKFNEAIPMFRKAIVQVKNETPLYEDLSEYSKKLMAQCFLNLAYCTLQDGDSRNPEETIESCDLAMEHINPYDHKLFVKAKFRKGLALEMLGKYSDAFGELREAMERSNEAVIVDAYVRVRDAMNVGN